MLYLITGANGAGKTLNTLKLVREISVKEARPVCHNGRFEPVEGGELSSWKKIDIKNWQDEPDGTIFVVDECHNDFPLRAPSSPPPEYVRMLAEHRRRGFDFYLVTQHPQNIDSFVRRLIGAPGWHRHLKRTFGADMVSQIEWPAVNPNCEKDGSGKSGTVTMVAFPKEVYTWYRSASLHTGKKRIPWRVWLVLVCVLAIPALGILGYRAVYANVTKTAKQAEAKGEVSAGAPMQTAQRAGPLTVAEYLDARKPRIADFPHSAPAYDQVTTPTVAPYPAACVEMGKRCDCYTQQGTLLRVAADTCKQIVRHGFFVDWGQQQQPAQQGQQQAQQQPQIQQAAQPQQVQAKTVPAPMPAEKTQPPQNSYLQGLAARNAQVRSSLMQ